jgi:hypothetical protein
VGIKKRRITLDRFLVYETQNYRITGLGLVVAAIILHSTDHSRNQNVPQLSLPGQFYIAAVSSYILITCVIYLIARTICAKKLIVFRLAIVLLGLGILLEITAVAAIVFVNSGIRPSIKKTTSIVVGSLTGYLSILQIYGIITSLSYLAQLRFDYEEMPLE